MRNTDWLSVKQVFQDAFMQPTGLRAAYVAAACGDDATLRHQVELLLASHKDAKTFLEGPAEAELEDLTTHHLEGQRIGQYKLVREIGAGGMGTAFLAVRADEAYEKRRQYSALG